MNTALLLTAPQSGAVIHFAGTQPPVPCSPTDDLNCSEFTTLDDSSGVTIASQTMPKSLKIQDLKNVDDNRERVSD